MNHIKKFESFEVNEELSPQKYDSIARGSRNRGDSRGRRVANTATDLKYRDYIGQSIVFKKRGQKDSQTDIIDEVKTNNRDWVSFSGKETKRNIVFKIAKEDNKKIVAVDSSGTYYEVDRKAAMLVAKAFNAFCKTQFKADALSQL